MSVIRRNIRRATIALSLGLMLAACGNGNQDSSNMIKQLPKALASIGKKPQPSGIAPEQIGKALAASPAPMGLFTLEARQAQFIMFEIERNGAHRTFGSASRQSIAFRGGMMTATRGLGGDLMSSEGAALYALVSGRRAGSARYDMRFLTPEDKTVTRSFDCSTTVAAEIPVQIGEINAQTRAVVATCKSDGFSFTDAYAVDKAGRILSARQWLGDALGYVSVQMLRY